MSWIKKGFSIKQLFFIMVGTGIYAFGLNILIIPNELMEGGVTGIALLLNYAFNLPPSYTTLFINIPLFYVGWRLFGKQSMILTIFGTVSLSAFLFLMEFSINNNWIQPFENNDYFLTTLYAGVASGVGLGIVFRYGGTTGGADIVARAGYKLKGWSIGKVLLAIDFMVIGASIFYIEKEKILYTLVVVFIAARIIDFIQEGAYSAKAFTIISDKSEEISESISNELERGLTLFMTKGAYSKKHREAVYCVVSRREIRRMTVLIKSIDPRAFIIISDVHDVLGEGFKEEEV
ncbi:YitT family protein [Chengkuizengella axinellae]|uniref:YitT family protein n=1 Tax=Chengkuizengella axinellae TaxID=3064388 RepID=A0ABT9IXI2_9BACL|nr:YitT family protein [Chengkuizengella sp. 2205SS18-9]MDP5273827.1 YitT family protein [Chengkuizengella sp. 2205SS18-9]